MRKTHIILLMLVAAAVCVIVSMFGRFNTYAGFAAAFKQPGKQYHVIGFLEKNKAMEYDTLKAPHRFSFYGKDKAGTISKVVFEGIKPADIEQSVQIVMTGYVEANVFRCTDIQVSGLR